MPAVIHKNSRGRAEGELEVLDKSPHTEVDYEPHSKHLPEKCGNCAHFIPSSPPRCQTVKSPISSAAWCERYDKKSVQNPASQVMSEWRAGKLHTSAGQLVPKGPRGEKMARAILLSELRREGKIGPRQNPAGSADELYRKFHGRGPDESYFVDVRDGDPYSTHPELAQLGFLLRFIVGEGVAKMGGEHGDEVVETESDDAWASEIAFVPIREWRALEEKNLPVSEAKRWLRARGAPDVAAEPNAKQIYIVGGNQNIEGQLGKLGADASKEYLDLGFIYLVEYFTQKRFDRFEPVSYWHHFGEKTHVQPRLAYDRLRHRLLVQGGEYQIRPEGITN